MYDEEFEQALKDSDNDLDFAEFEENQRFQLPKGKHWKDIRETTVNVGMAIQDAMREIEKANPDKPKLHISIICPVGQRMQSFWNGYIEVNLVKKKQ